MKKLAILLYGISYKLDIPIPLSKFSLETKSLVENYCRCKCKPYDPYPAEYANLKLDRSYSIDFQQSWDGFNQNIINVFRSVYDKIDTFISTYEHELIPKLQTMYNPKKITVYKQDQDIPNYGLDMVNSSEYNHILILRFENYYPIPFPLHRLNYNLRNRCWEDDNTVIFFPSNKNVPMYENYLCVKLNVPECYPDFVFSQRRMSDYTEKKLQLVEVSESNTNWVMSMNVAKHIVIVTSCINVDSSPLNYYPVRSLYTSEERLHHTMVTIATLREKIPNLTIILMNNNELTHSQHVQLLDACDYVFIFDSVQLDTVTITADFVKSFPNKSCSETASLYYACQRIKNLELDFDYVWKISGRTYLKEEFNLEDWPPLTDQLTGPPKGYGINNSLYNVPRQMLDYYMDRLKYCCLACYHDPTGANNSMVEWKLFEIAYNNDSKTHYFLPCLAEIAGLCTVDNTHKHWYR